MQVLSLACSTGLTHVFGIDPGPTASGVVWFDGREVLLAGHLDNDEILEVIDHQLPISCALVVEKVVSYGKPVGGPTFETVFWSGRFVDRAEVKGMTWARLAYRDCRGHFTRASIPDRAFRELLAARFGGLKVARGRKSAPGPLWAVSGHAWDALAVALTWWDRQQVVQAMTTTEGD
jgi:hypothetical protein